jgi:HPt (histidine-containing phosphotransfer) domain-containing protein
MDRNVPHLPYEYLDQERRKMIMELMDGDVELVVDLLDTMVETTPVLLAQLEDAIHSENANQIRESAHAMKSSNAQLGAITMAELCQRAEYMGKSNNLKDATKIFYLIRDEYSRVEKALSSWKESIEGENPV